MEAEVEAIFENHVEAKVGALMRKKNESGSRGDFEKNRAEAKENLSFSWKQKQKRRLLKNFQNSSLRF